MSKEAIPAFEAPQVDAELAALGRENFATFGCANCHDDVGVPAEPRLAFSQLNSAQGCLSEASGAWPHFDLDAEQRDLIAKALPGVEQPHCCVAGSDSEGDAVVRKSPEILIIFQQG